jgi:phosphoadenosine phosphosulfate reductase
MAHSTLNIKPTACQSMSDDCIKTLNHKFEKLTSTQRIEQAARWLPDNLAMTSSFGIDSAVSLHLINQVIPGITVILIDTGYLFPETYQYAELLQQKLNLNLQVHQSPVSAARFESQYGKLWLQGVDGLNQYNQMRKVKPLNQAMTELNISSWFSGVRRSQSSLRQQLPWISFKNQRYKVHPLLDWTDRDLYMYNKKHHLPQHPLYHQGYLSVGDSHSTQSIHEVDDLSEVRFFGLKRECGIHE